MKIRSVAALGALLFAFTPTFADDAPAAPAATDAAKPAEPAKPEDEMICRRTKLTGTNLLGPRICKSKKVWEQQHQDSQDMLNQQQQKGLLHQPAGG